MVWYKISSLAFCVISLLMNFGIVLGQGSTNDPVQPRLVVDGILPYALEWSDQAPLLSFGDGSLPGGGVQTEFDTWYQFNVEQETLTQGNRWPLQIALPSALEGQVLPNGLVFTSPSGRYIVFPSPFSEPGVSEGSEVRIYDIQQDYIIDTGIPSGGGARTVGYFDIRWGNDDSFVVVTIPESGGLPARLNLYYANLNGSEVSVHLLTSIALDDTVLLVFDVFDVSSDGRSVLLQGGIQGEFQSFLGIWDAQAPNDLFRIPVSQIDVLTVLDAKFASDNGTKFVFFDDQGVGRYNIPNETLEIINNQVTAQAYRYAEFSPDTEVLALASVTAVYWLDLRPSPATQTPTFTFTPTETATYTPTGTPTSIPTDTPTATHTPTPPTGGPNQILFASSVTGLIDLDIYRINPDGTGLTLYRVTPRMT